MKSKSMDEHKKRAPKSVNGAVITLSDSKYQDFLSSRKSKIFDVCETEFRNRKNPEFLHAPRQSMQIEDLLHQNFLNFDCLEGNEDNDISGKLIKDALNEKNKAVFYSVIPDESDKLLSTIDSIIDGYDVDVIITTGGTGIGPRDITIETLKPIFDKELNGFGEIFRYESYKELGTGAILSRATAGVYKGKLIVSMPGSPNAVKLGLKIISPELGHLVKHLKE